MSKTTGKKSKIEFTGESSAVESARFYCQVGRALTAWALTENKLSEFYCMLVCGEYSPSEGAVTTFANLRSFEDRRNLIINCLDQVLYPDPFNEFRKACKKELNSLLKLSQIRNKIAHGAAFSNTESGEFLFHPFYMHAISYRQKGLLEMHGKHPSAVKTPIQWDIDTLTENAAKVEDAVPIAIELVNKLRQQYEENEALLRDTTRMLLRPGLPFRDLPEDRKKKGKPHP